MLNPKSQQDNIPKNFKHYKFFISLLSFCGFCVLTATLSWYFIVAIYSYEALFNRDAWANVGFQIMMGSLALFFLIMAYGYLIECASLEFDYYHKQLQAS